MTSSPASSTLSQHTALTLTVYGCDVEKMKILLEQGVDPDEQASKGETALMLAAHYGFDEMINLLIDNGADPNKIQGADGSTALTWAMRWRDNPNTIKLLIDRGADINHKKTNGDTPLIIAAERGELDTLCLLINEGADMNCKNNDGLTALLMAEMKSKNPPEDTVKSWQRQQTVQILSDAAAAAKKAEEERIKRVASPAVLRNDIPAPKLLRLKPGKI